MYNFSFTASPNYSQNPAKLIACSRQETLKIFFVQGQGLYLVSVVVRVHMNFRSHSCMTTTTRSRRQGNIVGASHRSYWTSVVPAVAMSYFVVLDATYFASTVLGGKKLMLPGMIE